MTQPAVTTCPAGHFMRGRNVSTWTDAKGTVHRRCKACARLRARARRHPGQPLPKPTGKSASERTEALPPIVVPPPKTDEERAAETAAIKAWGEQMGAYIEQVKADPDAPQVIPAYKLPRRRSTPGPKPKRRAPR
jgi:hypothetical protein